MIDSEVVRAARGMAVEALGTAMRNDEMVTQGRLEQFQALRRRQLRKAQANWAQLSWTDRAGVVARRLRPPKNRAGSAR